MTVARRKTSDFSKSIRYLSIFLKTTCNPILFSICSHTSRGDATDADLDSPQEQTGKGASLRAPRAESGRPAPLAPGQHFGDRMETGEVEAKVLCGWPERRSSMGLPCSENTEEPRRRYPPGLFFLPPPSWPGLTRPPIGRASASPKDSSARRRGRDGWPARGPAMTTGRKLNPASPA